MREIRAAARGCEAAGYPLRWQRASVWDESQALPFSFVLTHGQRLGSGNVARAHREAGVPVLTLDLPPLRLDGYFALWRDHINAVPQTPRDPDRFDSFGLNFKPWVKPGREVLLCGQKDGDQSHGFNAQQLAESYYEWARHLKAVGLKVTWRPHPRFRFSLDGYPASDPEVPIEETLRDYSLVATINSTCGLKALLAGVPVLSDPTAFYASLCETSTLKAPRPYRPKRSVLRAFFARLAYCQWTMEELETGVPILLTLGSD